MTNLLAIIAGFSWAVTPLPIISTHNVQESLFEMAQEIQRRDCTRGCTIRGNLTVTGTLTGGASLTSSQTFSGLNTFLATTTLTGPTVIGSTVSIGVSSSNVYVTTANYSYILRGGLTEVAIATFTAASQVFFTNVRSSWTHFVELDILQNTSNASIQTRFDIDAGTVYRWTTRRELSDGTGENQSSASDTECQFTGASLVKAGEYANSRIQISRNPAAPRDFTHALFHTAFKLSDDNFTNTIGSCEYKPSGAGDGVLSVLLYPSAGTWTGVARLLVEVPSVNY